MQKYIIVTESGSDLSLNIIGQHDIQVLPMHVAIADADYADGSISIEELCNYYDKTGKIPTTSAVSPYEYQQLFEKIGAENPEVYIIHISYSSRVSSTFQNALIADTGENYIHHIDSLNVSGGFALIVMKAAQWIEQHPGITPEDLVARINEFAFLTRFCFIPGNLDFLRAGGRVSNAQHLGAILFKLRPLIEIVDGKLISTRKYRGSMKSVAQEMIKDFFSKSEIDKKEVYLVHSSRVDDDVKADMEKYVRELGVKKVVWLQTGCVITTHVGPGGIGIAAMVKMT
jgi:DegV family protein with EDD domain